MRLFKAFGRFWYDFIIGDDWKIAVAVVLVLLAGVGLLAAGVGPVVLAVTCGLLFLVAFSSALMIDTRS